MHHKRKGPKSTQAGCLLCKPHKRQGASLKSRQRHSAFKAMDHGLSPMESSYVKHGSVHSLGQSIEIDAD